MEEEGYLPSIQYEVDVYLRYSHLPQLREPQDTPAVQKVLTLVARGTPDACSASKLLVNVQYRTDYAVSLCAQNVCLSGYQRIL